MSVRGSDSTQFLQGLISQDINLFQHEPDRAAIYTCFMNVKGKLLYDSIIAKPLLANQSKNDMEYWVDVAQDDVEHLMKHLKVSPP